MENRIIDSTDRHILSIIQTDARVSNAEIARQVGLAPSAVLERIRKLEDRKVIRGYAADVDPKVLDYGLTAIVTIQTSECGGGVGEDLAVIPEVLEVHEVVGDDCFIIKVRVRDTEDLGRLLRERIKGIPRVLDTRTTVVIKTFKETTAMHIDVASRAGAK